MKENRWILGLVIVIIVVGGLVIWGFKKSGTKPKENTEVSTSGTTTGNTTNTNSENYFSDNASVSYYFQDNCSRCLKQKDVLVKLGGGGYRVKPANIGGNHPENQHLWQDDKISGTPTFIAKNGDRLEGYQEYDKLKAFLDSHK